MEGTRPLLVLLATLALAECALTGCGSPGAPHRHELIDSRDNYDPRSLDPALSTDVPTGRAVGYLFDGLTRFSTLTPRSSQRSPSAGTSHPTASHTPSISAAASLSPTASPVTARTVADSWQRALDPATKSGAAQFLFPIKGAREFNAGKATSRRRHRGARRLARSSSRSPSRSRSSSRCSRCPSRRSCPSTHRPTSANIPSAPARGSSSSGSTTTICSSPRIRRTSAARRRPIRCARASSPSRAPPSRNTRAAASTSCRSPRRRRPTGRRTRAASRCSCPRRRSSWCTSASTRRAGRSTDARVRQAINYAVDTDRIIERLVSGRGTHAAGVIPPALGGYDSTRKPYPYDPAKAKQLLAAAGHPNGIDIELWSSDGSALPHDRADGAGVPRRRRHSREARAARSRRRPRRGAKGADGHDHQGLVRRLSRRRGLPLSACSTRRIAAPAATSRSTRIRRSTPSSRRRAASSNETKRNATLPAGRLDRVRRRADGLSVLLRRAVRRAAVDQALRAAGDLQRPALDGRHHRRPPK